MTVDEIIGRLREDAGEWLEMSDNPDALIAAILAKRLVQQNDYIEYLERRLNLYDLGREIKH